ncbi:MAG: chromosome segregation protein SMC [Anaerolineae bacterium]
MPRLRKLELQGFKSFADPSTFLFPTGVTAVVGPNGSGKSNIADAIRWVLGEQRLTSIRGKTGEDMIFAGSKRRARAGMARAAITFDNSDSWLPVEFAEITVERRTYRDGTSDYILNGNKVRLMDLRDLLNRGGLGRDAYLVIGQGLVDQVLSLRPQERLALFEQAAGITPYRSRREDAVERLEETKLNLQRIYDIVGEIEPRLRRLHRQAAKVEEHDRLQQELSGTLRIWYGYRWARSLAMFEQVRQRVAYREDKALALLEQVEALTAKAVDQRHQINQRRERLAELHRLSSAQHTEAGNRQRELAVAQERRRQLQDRIEESEANLGPLRSAFASAQEEMEALKRRIADNAERLAKTRTHLAEAESAQKALAQQRHEVLRRQTEREGQALELRHRLADRQSRLDQAQSQLEEVTDQIHHLEDAIASNTEVRRQQQREVEFARRRLDAVQERLQAAQQEEEDANTALEAARSELGELERMVGRKEADHQRVSARLEALDRLHAEGAGMYAGVRAVLQAVQDGELEGLPGPISTLVRVPEQLERAVEAALGSQIQNVVAASWEDAQAAIHWLKRKRAGRATFLPLDSLRPPSLLNPPSVPGIVGVASELISYDDVYQPAVQLLLGRTAVAESLVAARRLYEKLHGGFRIVTLEGEIVRSGGSVTGGDDRNGRGAGLLERERERRELRREAGALREEVQAFSHQRSELTARVQSLEVQRVAARSRRQEVVVKHQDAEREVEQAVRELERTLQEGEWQQSRLEAAGESRRGLGELIDRLHDEAVAAQQRLTTLSSQLSELKTELNRLTDDQSARLVAERRTEVAVLAQEHESLEVLLESQQREATRIERQVKGQEHRIRSLTGELRVLEEDLEAMAKAYEKAQAEAEALSGEIPPLEAELAEMEQNLDDLEAREQEGQRALREAEQLLSQAEVEAGRREDQLQSLRREIEETLGIVVDNIPDTISVQQPLPLEAIVAPLPTVVELPEGLESQIRDLRTQIRRLQPINPGAREEYEELAERHGFLREQMEDLERASTHLRQIINELDEMMDTMFSTTFDSIAAEFSRVFDMLFNGGAASLNLVEEEGDRIGVEITARPPGKRTSGLSMLSGGERSLTAVALLFAVMRVSPTPFCVLDEVDAMLDEANVGRFRRMLVELSRETQFVIITHNRGTVDVADTIYGISMGDDGVSQKLSLSLEDLPASEAV